MKLNAAYETGKYDYLGRQEIGNKNIDAVKAGFKTADQAVEDVIVGSNECNTDSSIVSSTAENVL